MQLESRFIYPCYSLQPSIVQSRYSLDHAIDSALQRSLGSCTLVRLLLLKTIWWNENCITCLLIISMTPVIQLCDHMSLALLSLITCNRADSQKVKLISNLPILCSLPNCYSFVRYPCILSLLLILWNEKYCLAISEIQ